MIFSAAKHLGYDSVKDLQYEVTEKFMVNLSKPSKSVHVLYYSLLYMKSLDSLAFSVKSNLNVTGFAKRVLYAQL